MSVEIDYSGHPDSPDFEAFRQRSFSTPNISEMASLHTDLHEMNHSYDVSEDMAGSKKDDESVDNLWEVQSEDALDYFANEDEASDASDSVPSGRQGKGRNIIGKIAKSVRKGTTTTGRKVVSRTKSTGKNVVRQSVKVGRQSVLGTVNASKAILPIRPKNPPKGEPKSAKRHTRRRATSRDLDIDVNSRSLRRVEMLESSSALPDSLSVLAGELSAPEQSRRTVSSMLLRMSGELESSPVCSKFSKLLGSLAEKTSTLDSTFLQGGPVQIGVAPNKVDANKGPLVVGELVARCLWESHWREEWCGLYEKGVLFYAPLTDSPCLELSIDDIKFVRVLNTDASPLAGYPLLVIETAWHCHYCAFSSEEARHTFHQSIETARLVAAQANESARTSSREQELAEARFWLGFQESIEVSLTLGRGKWANVQSGSKMKSRVVLNSRRMVFDLAPVGEDPNAFVEDLLSTCLSFSLDSLKENPEALIKFLDATSQLRKLSLGELDLYGARAFCLFVNVYHCLFQHALLFSVKGPLHKRSCAHFMRTSCYEIGGDVFSLAEINCCVVRGNMTRPVIQKPPYIDVSKKSNAFRFYALGFTTPRVNFLLNTGDVSCPRAAPVLNPLHLEAQLNSQVADFVRSNVTVDVSRKLVIIPKICEVYRNDFAAADSNPSVACLRYCLRFLDEPTADQIYALLQDEATIKYQHTAEQYHSNLERRVMEEEAL
jgi:hypothetical protein